MDRQISTVVASGSAYLVSVEDETLDWSPVVEGIINHASLMGEKRFLRWLIHIYGTDIPRTAYRSFAHDLLAKTLISPKVSVVGEQTLGADRQGAYEADRQTIYVARELVIDARTEVPKALHLYAVLLEEFGHHIDHLLRNVYSGIGGDAEYDEGAIFALNMIQSDNVNIYLGDFARHNSGIHISDEQTGASNDHDIEHHRISLLDEQFHAERLKADQQGWIRLPSGELVFAEFFEAGTGSEHGFGHQSIEDVLREIGFSRQVCKEIYFGNWLRDYSQVIDDTPIEIISAILPGDPSRADATEILVNVVDLLAGDHFRDLNNFRVTPENLRDYQSEEHIDNPFRSGEPSPRIAPETKAKAYISESVDFIVRSLQKAQEEGATRQGYIALGEGLHTLEDFYAHSNYIEIVSKKIGRDVDVKVQPIVVPPTRNEFYPLVTGSFCSLDAAMSITADVAKSLPSTENEVFGQRSKGNRLLLILLRRSGHGFDRLADLYEYFLRTGEFYNTLTGPVIWIFKQAVVSASKFIKKLLLSGIITYLLTELKRSLLAKAIESGRQAHLPPDTTDEDLTEEERLWQDVFNIAEALGPAVTDQRDREMLNKLNRNAFPELRTEITMSDYEVALNQVYELAKLYQDLSEVSNSTDPSHTQLAKDHATHYLHDLAAKLAMMAVKEVGRKMQQAINGPIDSRDESLNQAIALVHEYLKHPDLQSSISLEADVTQWWREHPGATPTEHRHSGH